MKGSLKRISPKPLFIVALLTLALGTAIWIFTQSKNESKIIEFPYNVTFTRPSNWVVAKRDTKNHIVLKNNGKDPNVCTIDVFSVRPDRDYAFKQWLGTSMENQSFLVSGRETAYKDKTVFIGSYNFYNENLNQPAKNERAILKAQGTIVDITMSYLDNESCTKVFDVFLDTVNF